MPGASPFRPSIPETEIHTSRSRARINAQSEFAVETGTAWLNAELPQLRLCKRTHVVVHHRKEQRRHVEQIAWKMESRDLAPTLRQQCISACKPLQQNVDRARSVASANDVTTGLDADAGAFRPAKRVALYGGKWPKLSSLRVSGAIRADAGPAAFLLLAYDCIPAARTPLSTPVTLLVVES